MLGFLNTETDFFHRPVSSLMDAILREEALAPVAFSVPMGKVWTGDALCLRFVMPGIGDKEFTLTARGDSLQLRGERKMPADFEASDSSAFALRYGRFEKMFTLPPGLDMKRLEAHFHHGVLDVRIPLREDAKAVAVPVSVEWERAAEAAA